MKKEKKLKPVVVRQEFAKQMKDKIENLGIPSSYPGIQEFYKVLDDYCIPNLMGGFSGKIKIPEINKIIEYTLPMRLEIEAVIRLSEYQS
jgi:hypothetical protein